MDLRTLSKTVSYALRHAPWEYELELDPEGWVSVASLINALSKERAEWASLSEATLAQMIKASDKPRHEIQDGKIRARYGHSLPGKLAYEAAEPPEVLYHGTAPETASKIATEGLHPMRRQYVHLSVDIGTARQVGQRKSRNPVILHILARQAYQEGTSFYRGNALIWLADHVAPAYVQGISELTDENKTMLERSRKDSTERGQGEER